MSRPKFSFVVIAYNEAQAISDCIKAIENQTGLTNYEIVVVDDGSTDNTAGIVKSHVKANKYIRLHSLGRNKGRGAARAAGIAAARGQYLALVDGDIELPRHWLNTCLPFMDTYDAVGGVAVPDGDAAYVCTRFSLDPKITKHSTTVTGSNGLYKRTIFEQIGFQSELREGEDVAFNHLMQQSQFRSVAAPELIVLHKEHKTFSQSMRWLYQSGLGAARQLKQFKEVRLPDLTYAAFMLSLLPSVGLGCLVWSGFLATPLLFLLAVSVLHIYTKFIFHPTQIFSYVAAIMTNCVLLACYFVGRTIGLAIAKVPTQ